jgi:large subunit ribosomal protein L29
MKAEECRALTTEEIHTQLLKAREEMMNFRFQQASGELADYSRIRFTRRQIARLLTILRERESAGIKEVSNE